MRDPTDAYNDDVDEYNRKVEGDNGVFPPEDSGPLRNLIAFVVGCVAGSVFTFFTIAEACK